MLGAQGQLKLVNVAKKSSTYDVTHKKPSPPKKKICFKCILEDLLHLLTLRLDP